MRINSLDYLRGLMALLIMIYHYLVWVYEPFSSEDFLGIMGVYGVSTFYVLSGLTLYYVYGKTLKINTTPKFFLKRFFRIYPLLWLTIILTIFLLNRSYPKETIFYNITGLFGFLAHDKYIATGAWSIGNELVFYSLFPIVIILDRKFKYVIEFIFLLSLIAGAYFSFNMLSSNEVLGGEQWRIYINPLNQAFLFFGGVLIGKRLTRIMNKFIGPSLIFLAILLLCFYPVSGNQINIVSGLNRFVFSALVFILTIGFYQTTFNIPKVFDAVFEGLGRISYTIYLIHPIVFWYLANFLDKKEMPILFLSICILSTLLFSIFVYEFLEKRFIILGKKIGSKAQKPISGV